VNILFSPTVNASLPQLSAPKEHSPDRLLAISESKKSGLILCKDFHAEFAGPGAAVSSPVEQPYKAVIAIGSPELISLEDKKARQQAYGRRIQWGRWLYKIAEHPDPIVRVERLFAGFEGFFGRQVVMNVPAEVIALLVGVFPETVKEAQEHYFNVTGGATTFLFPQDQLKVTTISLEALSHQPISAPLGQTATMREIHQTYELLKTA
jgi:hypothetical protein